jgi:hypothetical protein
VSRSQPEDHRFVRLYPWLEKAKANQTKSKRLIRQLERVKILSLKQDSLVINSWDITYQENLKKFEKKTARFVIEEEEAESALLGGGSDSKLSQNPSLKKKRTTLEQRGRQGSSMGSQLLGGGGSQTMQLQSSQQGSSPK